MLVLFSAFNIESGQRGYTKSVQMDVVTGRRRCDDHHKKRSTKNIFPVDCSCVCTSLCVLSQLETSNLSLKFLYTIFLSSLFQILNAIV